MNDKGKHELSLCSCYFKTGLYSEHLPLSSTRENEDEIWTIWKSSTFVAAVLALDRLVHAVLENFLPMFVRLYILYPSLVEQLYQSCSKFMNIFKCQ